MQRRHSDLTLEQKATNNDTWRHIHRVQSLLFDAIHILLERAKAHDQSKLATPEVEAFTELTPKLAGTTYGSPEYNTFLEQMKPALEHHYARNRHHPQHFKDGINDMNLFDLVEMICDWKAAGERHNDGNLRKSIEHNASRFEISPQLLRILENTADLIDNW